MLVTAPDAPIARSALRCRGRSRGTNDRRGVAAFCARTRRRLGVGGVGARRDLCHRPQSQLQHDAAERDQRGDLACANARLTTGTPAPIISRAHAPDGAHHGKVHPQRWPATGDGGGYAEAGCVVKLFFGGWREPERATPCPGEIARRKWVHTKTRRTRRSSVKRHALHLPPDIVI